MNQFLPGIVLLQAAAGGATGSMLSTLIPFALIFVIFYFLIIRPQNKKQKDMQKMIEAVKKGDRVVTIGGVHAMVHSVKETTVILKVDDATKMEFSKSAIASVTAKGEDKSSEPISEKPATDKPSTDKPAEEK